MAYKKSVYELFEESCKLINIADTEMISPSKCRFTNIQQRDRNSIKCKHIDSIRRRIGSNVNVRRNCT